uniref:Glycoprotein-N-acetylgalactosamine 3-beta-galactosyltransferase 1 n=1 Tax=Dendroctonus ponderosae TaxID=77166 RepID=J3JVY2_DENPD|nr:unknown [Dendroctonus ponderosae]
MSMSRILLIPFVCKPSVQIFLAGLIVGLTLGLLILFIKTDNSRSNYFKNMQDYNSYFSVGRGHSEADTHHAMINTTLADELFSKVKVLCWIMTSPSNHLQRAVHVKATWGKRCNKIIFMSSAEEPLLPTVVLPVTENRENLWGKAKEALKYLYRNYYHEYDWFFKADDDTYAVMENLRYLLYYKNSSQPVYYGCKLKVPDHNFNYMSGGAGYVLSKAALQKFVIEALPDMLCRQQNNGLEDVEIGKCLQAVGVNLGNSLDNEYRHRFTPVFVNEMLVPGVLNDVDWYMKMMYNPNKFGLQCCSDNLITTHYVKPHQMYLLEYLIYHVTPFGRAYNPTLPQRFT